MAKIRIEPELNLDLDSYLESITEISLVIAKGRSLSSPEKIQNIRQCCRILMGLESEIDLSGHPYDRSIRITNKGEGFIEMEFWARYDYDKAISTALAELFVARLPGAVKRLND